MLDSELDASDSGLGAAGTTYPSGVVGRGLDYEDAEGDSIVVSCDLLEVNKLANGARIDQIRVITSDQPCRDIDIEKATNGFDADAPTGPFVPVGDPVLWDYVVTNTGQVDLFNITVTDDILGLICTYPGPLAVGSSFTCTASGTAMAGQYANMGSVYGEDSLGRPVVDQDPSHYFGEEQQDGEGCTPGYWRQDQHFDSWVSTGYVPTDDFNAVFGVTASFDPHSLLDAVWLGGGGEEALARHGVAALLNATSPDVAYSYSAAEVISYVQSAYASGDFEDIKDMFEAANETFCPID